MAGPVSPATARRLIRRARLTIAAGRGRGLPIPAGTGGGLPVPARMGRGLATAARPAALVKIEIPWPTGLVAAAAVAPARPGIRRRPRIILTAVIPPPRTATRLLPSAPPGPLRI